ncbi:MULTISPECIES: DUF3311 domain-containing protein [Acidocella]|uniref:DUF3311 domain-containing protein n=1 Tax=Acidocella TaxID=50709 RepID=UPI000346FCB7|nr:MULTISPECIES: DUF3311 domain-containing protein [Acidocella]WBO60126.1 DUF3311 domain-containing protein [Acidocella sp. MX-AZ03]
MIRLLFFVIIFVIALWVPLYNKVDPTLFGFPFFYWFQMLVVIAASVMIWIVYKVEDKEGADK